MTEDKTTEPGFFSKYGLQFEVQDPDDWVRDHIHHEGQIRMSILKHGAFIYQCDECHSVFWGTREDMVVMQTKIQEMLDNSRGERINKAINNLNVEGS